MKLCQIIYTLRSGGAESLARDLAFELRACGHDVLLILVDRADNDLYTVSVRERLEKAGVHVLCLNRTPGSVFSFFCAISRLAAVFRREAFDAVHSHLALTDIMTYAAIRLSGRSIVHAATVHSSASGTLPPHSLTGRVWRFCHKRIRTVYCSAVSEKENVPVLGDGVCIPNGCPFRVPDPARAKAWLGENRIDTKGRQVILSVGSMNRVKNRRLMFEAAAKLVKARPNLLLIVAGGGALRTEYEAQISELGLKRHVVLPGVCTCVCDLHSVADLYLSASTYEGLPISVLEALGDALPCLLSPIPSHTALAEQTGAAVIFPEFTADALAGALDAALGNLAELRRTAQSGRETFRMNYSIQKCAESYLKLYTK